MLLFSAFGATKVPMPYLLYQAEVLQATVNTGREFLSIPLLEHLPVVLAATRTSRLHTARLDERNLALTVHHERHTEVHILLATALLAAKSRGVCSGGAGSHARSADAHHHASAIGAGKRVCRGYDASVSHACVPRSIGHAILHVLETLCVGHLSYARAYGLERLFLDGFLHKLLYVNLAAYGNINRVVRPTTTMNGSAP